MIKAIGRENGKIWKSPVFLSALGLKLVFSFFFASHYMTQLFIPFVSRFVISGFSNPWEFFFSAGRTNMFPYPPVMLLIMSAARVLFVPFLPPDWEAVSGLHLFAMRLPLLFFDFLILAVLLRFFPVQQKKVLLTYWCSPIVFFITYLHGQLDVVPTALFFLAVYFLVQERSFAAFALLAVAAATKTHVLIGLPFFLMFLYKKKVGFWGLVLPLLFFAGLYGFLLAPYAGSHAFREMVFHSPEQRKLFEFNIPISPSLNLIVCPTVVVLLFIKFASYQKLNREILLMFLGIVFVSLVVFVPAMPGWFLWSLPFLVYFYINNRDYSRAPFILYNAIYLGYFLVFFEREKLPFGQAMGNLPVKDLALSAMIASVGFIAFWMFQLGVRKNEELRLAEAPFLIGIGGDSSSGKHTLLRSLRILTGKNRSIPIFGDDFHKWERGNENWSVYTHLNPTANRLHQGAETAIALREGHSVEMVHYDHRTGKFSDAKVVQPNKFIFFVGLHPFYLKTMRDIIHLKIFMDPDPELRKHWKVERDVRKRGYQPEKVAEQIESREPDRVQYILPQKDFADLTVRYSSLEALKPAMENRSFRIKTTYTLDNSVDLSRLVEALSKVGTLRLEHASNIRSQELTVSGVISTREVMNAAYQLGLNFDELFINTRGWLKNHHGVNQLVFLVLYNHKRKAR